MPDPQTTIFISYAHSDSALVDRLESDLRAQGFDTWLDSRRLTGGQKWRRELQAALDHSQVLLVVLSPDAIATEFVQLEYGYAIDEGKVVIPLYYRPCKVPMELRTIQSIDFQGSYEQGLDALLKVLNSRQSMSAITASAANNSVDEQEAPPLQQETAAGSLSSRPGPEVERSGNVLLRRSPFALLLIVIIILGLSLYSLLSQKSTSGLPNTPIQVVGNVSFGSSGTASQNTSQEIIDELRINLQGIPSPHPGKSYYAWLLGDTDNSEAQPIFLGQLPVNHGQVDYLYPGDQQHTNLIANTSRFLITEEDASTPPLFPSTDPAARLYFAVIPQTPSPTDTLHHYSLLDHLRHLLSADPKLNSVMLYGGLDFWFLKNASDISQWATDVKNAWQQKSISAMRQHTIDILYYLDGIPCIAQDVVGLPKGTPTAPENPTIANIARVGLLQLCTQQPIPGYLTHILAHLNGVMQSPGVNPAQLKLVGQITTEMDHLNILLKNVLQDARQLVKMTSAQLLQPSAQSLVDAMATAAIAAYSGQTNSPPTLAQSNVQQIHDDIQRLATLEVTPCLPGSPSNVCA